MIIRDGTSANLFGVLAAAVWTVSGDEVGAKKRPETLHEYRVAIFGEDDPSSDQVRQSE